jgi:hypothetical protein
VRLVASAAVEFLREYWAMLTFGALTLAGIILAVTPWAYLGVTAMIGATVVLQVEHGRTLQSFAETRVRLSESANEVAANRHRQGWWEGYQAAVWARIRVLQGEPSLPPRYPGLPDDEEVE